MNAETSLTVHRFHHEIKKINGFVRDVSKILSPHRFESFSVNSFSQTIYGEIQHFKELDSNNANYIRDGFELLIKINNLCNTQTTDLIAREMQIIISRMDDISKEYQIQKSLLFRSHFNVKDYNLPEEIKTELTTILSQQEAISQVVQILDNFHQSIPVNLPQDLTLFNSKDIFIGVSQPLDINSEDEQLLKNPINVSLFDQ